MSLSYARILAMVRLLEKSPTHDVELVARLKGRAKAMREAQADVQAAADLEAYLAGEKAKKGR